MNFISLDQTLKFDIEAIPFDYQWMGEKKKNPHIFKHTKIFLVLYTASDYIKMNDGSINAVNLKPSCKHTFNIQVGLQECEQLVEAASEDERIVEW